jgi:hypothetical protein
MMLTSSFVSLYYYRIVGQVAISGQHQWIFSEYLNDSHSTLQVHNGWESQISAGIKVSDKFSVFFLFFACPGFHVFCVLLSIAWDILVVECFFIFIIRLDIFYFHTFVSFSSPCNKTLKFFFPQRLHFSFYDNLFLHSLQTILIVAVGSCGVVQLGSLCKVSKMF